MALLLRSSGMNVIVVFVIHMYVTGRVIYIYGTVSSRITLLAGFSSFQFF